jgi:hypothetical protein
LLLDSGSVQFLGSATEPTLSSDSKKDDLLVKESLSALDEDNETSLEVLLVNQPSEARIYLLKPFLLKVSEFLRLAVRVS